MLHDDDGRAKGQSFAPIDRVALITELPPLIMWYQLAYFNRLHPLFSAKISRLPMFCYRGACIAVSVGTHTLAAILLIAYNTYSYVLLTIRAFADGARGMADGAYLLAADGTVTDVIGAQQVIACGQPFAVFIAQRLATDAAAWTAERAALGAADCAGDLEWCGAAARGAVALAV